MSGALTCFRSTVHADAASCDRRVPSRHSGAWPWPARRVKNCESKALPGAAATSGPKGHGLYCILGGITCARGGAGAWRARMARTATRGPPLRRPAPPPRLLAASPPLHLATGQVSGTSSSARSPTSRASTSH